MHNLKVQLRIDRADKTKSGLSLFCLLVQFIVWVNSTNDVFGSWYTNGEHLK